MAYRSTAFCKQPGCRELVSGSAYCVKHTPLHQEAERQRDVRRGSAHARGYNYRWSKYSKHYLSQPQNQFCKLHLDDGCAVVAQCVDHIKPHDGQHDPLFWDARNHQPACIHCNSVKGSRDIVGTYTFGAEGKRQ